MIRIFLLVPFLFISNTASSHHEYKWSSCNTNIMDCSLIRNDPATLCYDSILHKDAWRIMFLQRAPLNSIGGADCWIEAGPQHRRRARIKVIVHQDESDLCPEGQLRDTQTGNCIRDSARHCEMGNPIEFSTGRKKQTEADVNIQIAGIDHAIRRHYISNPLNQNLAVESKKWFFQFEDRLSIVESYYGIRDPENLLYVAFLREADGTTTQFSGATPNMLTSAIASDFTSLEAVTDGANNITSWLAKKSISNEQYEFNTEGKLIRYRSPQGDVYSITHGFNYTSAEISHAGNVLYTYYKDGYKRVESISVGGAFDYTYEYETNGNLAKVIYPDFSEKTYLYDNPNEPDAITGVVDERGILFTQWQYNTLGQATKSEHALGTETYSIDYSQASDPIDPRVAFTNEFGRQTIVHYQTFSGKKRPILIEKSATLTSPATSVRLTYDTDGYLTSRTEADGSVTTYNRDNQGRKLRIIHGTGTSEEQNAIWEWHPSMGVPTRILKGTSETLYTYNNDGKVLTKTEVLPNSNDRVWTYTYDADNRLLTEDGPRTDVTDITTHTYDTAGNLATIINAQGHEVRFQNYDAYGRAQTIIDANNIQTDLIYNSRGWLISSTQLHPSGDSNLDITTSYEYDATGQLTQVTHPNGLTLTYAYNDAKYLVSITNQQGEKIEYGVDNNGNRVSETIEDAQGTILYQIQQTYDEANKLATMLSSAGGQTNYLYNNRNSINTLTNPSNVVTKYEYDSLNRIQRSIDPLLGETVYTYDDNNRVTSLTNPNGNTTSFVYDEIGNLKQLSSPDRGTWIYDHDSNGNVTNMTDARNVETVYTYDSLNRITTVNYPSDASKNISYTYDVQSTNNYGAGLLSSVTGNTWNYNYIYNHQRNITNKTYQLDGQAFTQDYEYTTNGELEQITYPSDAILRYQRNSLGEIINVVFQETANSPSTTLLSNIDYSPFGPINAAELGNALTINYQYDLDYRLTDMGIIGAGTLLDANYSYDLTNNITGIANNTSLLDNQSFTYDLLDRIDTANGGYGNIDYDYDAVGNRTNRTIITTTDTTTETLAYENESNRIDSKTTNINGTSILTQFTLDANGNEINRTTPQGPITSIYGADNRIEQISTPNGTIEFEYNAFNQRIKKESYLGTEYYHYNENGQLIAVSNNNGNLHQEYFYLDTSLIALFDHIQNQLYYVHNDQLGTPIALTDTNGVVVWNLK